MKNKIISVKDQYILNDFFGNIFFMEKNYVYNFKLDDLVIILQNISILIKSQKNSHRKTALNCGLKYLKIISEVR